MAPRNNDSNTSYKKQSFPIEDSEANGKEIVSCLLHKKHKVVKLVKNQMQKIQEEGFICNANGAEEAEALEGGARVRRALGGSVVSSGLEAQENGGLKSLCWGILKLLLLLFLLILLMVWISAGPLSNSIAHTPVPVGSFVRTEGLCSLEKKYLLRWTKPDYFE